MALLFYHSTAKRHTQYIVDQRFRLGPKTTGISTKPLRGSLFEALQRLWIIGLIFLFLSFFYNHPADHQILSFIFNPGYAIFVIVIIMKIRKAILYPYSMFCAKMNGGIVLMSFINNPATNY